MSKPTGERCAEVAVESLIRGITYAEMDCQAYLEWVVKQAGGKMDYAGSNAMARACHKNGTMCTLAEAKKNGRLVKGAFMFIHEATGQPDKYKKDGYGNYSHVAMYVGEKAVQDADKNGNMRWCNGMHSSQTMGRVAGTTTANGFTHVGWMPQIDYGSHEQTETGGDSLYQAKVKTNVNVRQGRGTDKQKVGLLQKGTVVNVYQTEKDWCRINYNDEVAGWCIASALEPIKGSTVQPSAPADPADPPVQVWPAGDYVTREEFDDLVERVKKLEAEYDAAE